MLISFEFENWMSFRDETEFSMVASRERRHGGHLTAVPKFRMRLLPITALYGGNASGKTNFFKALAFARHFIVHGTPIDTRIPVQPFQLDPDMAEKPVKMCFGLLLKDVIYEFSFAVTESRVVEEKLVQVLTTGDRVLYHRHDGKPHFHRSLEKDQRLHFVFEGTRDNQLFLTNAVSQKIDRFKPIFDWFRKKLVLIAPDTRFKHFPLLMQREHPMSNRVSRLLSSLDTGIECLTGEKVDFDNLQIPQDLRDELIQEVSEENPVCIRREPSNERLVVERSNNGVLTAKKLIASHKSIDGKEIFFDINQESDGSQRLVDLVPAFIEASAPTCDRLFVFDELDRSLHTKLLSNLIKFFLLERNQKSRCQILFTTHDLMLMDQDIFRRDELWVAERDQHGGSSLISFSEYSDIRYDKDVRKSYLQGRMGGIPRLLEAEQLYCAEDE